MIELKLKTVIFPSNLHNYISRKMSNLFQIYLARRNLLWLLLSCALHLEYSFVIQLYTFYPIMNLNLILNTMLHLKHSLSKFKPVSNSNQAYSWFPVSAFEFCLYRTIKQDIHLSWAICSHRKGREKKARIVSKVKHSWKWRARITRAASRRL